MAEIEASAGGAPATGGVGRAAETPQQRRARRAALPQYRNIGLNDITVGYKLAWSAKVSILHRVSGVLMFLVGIPFMLYLLQTSITSELSFMTYQAVVGSWLGKLVVLALLWSFFHHLCAGIRFLLLDVHVGMEREQAARSARIVLIASVVLTLLAAVILFSLG